jgi:hypothetical protein
MAPANVLYGAVRLQGSRHRQPFAGSRLKTERPARCCLQCNVLEVIAAQLCCERQQHSLVGEWALQLGKIRRFIAGIDLAVSQIKGKIRWQVGVFTRRWRARRFLAGVSVSQAGYLARGKRKLRSIGSIGVASLFAYARK